MTTSTQATRFGPNVVVLVARVVLLFAALGLAGAGIAVAVHDTPTAGSASRLYSCPMHPEVSGTSSGQCPICKMSLELASLSKPLGAAAEHPPDCPMHAKSPAADVKSPGPNATPRALPSPEFAGGMTWLPETRPPAARGTPADRPILESPKRRVFVDGVRAPAWLETTERLSAVLYRDELVGLAPGERGRFFRASTPRIPIEVRLGDESPAPWDASTSIVRFVVERSPSARDEGGLTLRDGDVGWLEMERRSRELLVFPESALLRSNDGPYVLVPERGGGFARRTLTIGRILKGHVVVLAGLREDDRIVVSRPFFFDMAPSGDSSRGPFAEALP